MDIKIYRRANALMAMWRDNCRCGMCGATADESDHVFGRSNKNSHPWLLEHWMLRMSMCRSCHYKKHHGSGFDMVKQAKCLAKTNLEFTDRDDIDACYLALKDSIAEAARKSEDTATGFIAKWLERNG